MDEGAHLQPSTPEYFLGVNSQPTTVSSASPRGTEPLGSISTDIRVQGPEETPNNDPVESELITSLTNAQRDIRSGARRAPASLPPLFRVVAAGHVVRIRPRRAEHGRLKTARHGLTEVRVQLAIWYSRRGLPWPLKSIKLDGNEQGSPAQLFLARSRAYLKFLRWDVRPAWQKQRILQSEDPNQRPRHGGRFAVMELPSLDVLLMTHPGLETQLMTMTAYIELYVPWIEG